MIEWQTLNTFPNYEVSTEGEVRNILTGRILKPKVNQQGVVHVGLMRDGTQFHRSVSLLVALAHIPRPAPNCDTPIHLDGDRYNNSVENLQWRPRWFAVEYARQFFEPYPGSIHIPIVDKHTRERFSSSWECAIQNGYLDKDLVLSILNKTYVWPGYREFEIL